MYTKSKFEIDYARAKAVEAVEKEHAAKEQQLATDADREVADGETAVAYWEKEVEKMQEAVPDQAETAKKKL